MLFNVILGNNLDTKPWKLIEDSSTGSLFFTNETIRQWIRLDKNLDRKLLPEVGAMNPKYSYGAVQAYEIPGNLRWVNNNTNMNPCLVSKRDTLVDKSEQHIIFITVKSNYKILGFHTNHRLLQTYHSNGEYQGCSVVLTKEEIEKDGTNVIEIDVFDTKKNMYRILTIDFKDSESNQLLIKKNKVENQDLFNTMRRKNQTRKTSTPFKIVSKENEFLTSFYLTREKFYNIMVKQTSFIKNREIINLPDDFNPETFTDEERNDFIKSMSEALNRKGRIRAITLAGVNLPIDIIHELKVLYVFTYDFKQNVLSCRKSN